MRIRSYTSAAALVCCVAAGQALRASTIATFTLGGDHNQVYNSENVAPYAGSLTGSGIVNFFCLDFNLVSYFGATYAGTVTKPQTQQEEEVEARRLGAGVDFRLRLLRFRLHAGIRGAHPGAARCRRHRGLCQCARRRRIWPRMAQGGTARQ